MRDSRILMTRGDKRDNSSETDKLYTAMANGRGVTEEMKQNWKKKPYYMVTGKEKK